MNFQFVCVHEGCVLDRIITTMPDFLNHSRIGHTVIEMKTFLVNYDAMCKNYNEQLDEICDEHVKSVQTLVRQSIQEICCKIEDYGKSISGYLRDLIYSKKQQCLSKVFQIPAQQDKQTMSQLQCYQALQFQQSNIQAIQEFSQKSYLQSLQLEDEFVELEQHINSQCTINIQGWQYLITKTEVKLTQLEKTVWEQVIIDYRNTGQIESEQVRIEPMDERKPLRGYKGNQTEKYEQQQQQQIDQIHQITNISEPVPLRGYKSNNKMQVDTNPFNNLDPEFVQSTIKQTKVDADPIKGGKMKTKQVPAEKVQEFDTEESDKHVQISKNYQTVSCKSLGFAIVTGTFPFKLNSHLVILISNLTVNETFFIGILDLTKFQRNQYTTTSEGIYGINQVGVLYNNKQLTQSNIQLERKQKLELKYSGKTQKLKIKAKGFPPANIIISDGDKRSVYQYFVSMSQAKVTIINYG